MGRNALLSLGEGRVAAYAVQYFMYLSSTEDIQNYVVTCCRVFDQYEIDIEVKKHRHSYLGREAVHPPVMLWSFACHAPLHVMFWSMSCQVVSHGMILAMQKSLPCHQISHAIALYLLSIEPKESYFRK